MYRCRRLATHFFVTLVAAMGAAPASAHAQAEGSMQPASTNVRPYVALGAGVSAMMAPGSGWIVLRPVEAEVGARLGPRIEVGLEGMYADGTEWTCGSCVGARRWQVGARARLHPWPAAHIDPWLGGGFGVERLYLPPTLNATLQPSFTGVDWPAVQAGVNLNMFGVLAVGPWISVEMVWLEPNAPAWTTEGFFPVQSSAGVRAIGTF
jgi:hypothetical protein